ncbi:hypothetical protein OR1_03032 [Geobacter sp. OR-1]|nr:hypothetical protein OR1_03032 [Geobacter sp. OR-1]
MTAISAFIVKPIKRSDQFGSKGDTVGIYFKTALIHLALPGNDIQVTTRGSGKKNGAILILQFFKAASAALMAEIFPFYFGRVTICHVRSIPNRHLYVNADEPQASITGYSRRADVTIMTAPYPIEAISMVFSDQGHLLAVFVEISGSLFC